jgi:hypothetical protein
VNEVAAVPQLGRFDDDDVHAESLAPITRNAGSLSAHSDAPDGS